MKHLYGEFSKNQIQETKKKLRKSIFFLLLCADENTLPDIKKDYGEVDVNKTFQGLLLKLGGMNQLLMEPPELVTIMSLLQAALIEYNKPEFDFQVYKRLVLDAGAEVSRLKEG